MKIVVCVKQVLDPRGVTVNRKAEKVFVNREEYVLDPASRAALQVAAAVKQELMAANGATPPQIVAISLGPDRVDDALREAMAFGADRAIHLKDAAFDAADAFVTANALAAAIRKVEAVDLVLLGAHSLDSGAGEMAGRLAEALDWPQASNAVSVEAKPGVVRIVRPWGESFARVTMSYPAVVAVMSEAFAADHPSGWRLMDAYKQWTVEAWSAADLGLGEEELRPAAARKEDAFPPERQPGTQVKDVKELAAVLKRERLI